MSKIKFQALTILTWQKNFQVKWYWTRKFAEYLVQMITINLNAVVYASFYFPFKYQICILLLSDILHTFHQIKYKYRLASVYEAF